MAIYRHKPTVFNKIGNSVNGDNNQKIQILYFIYFKITAFIISIFDIFALHLSSRLIRKQKEGGQ